MVAITETVKLKGFVKKNKKSFYNVSLRNKEYEDGLDRRGKRNNRILPR